MPRDNMPKTSKPVPGDIEFIPNPLTAQDPDRYITINVHVPAVLESWRGSLFSFEWLHPDGTIKIMSELSTPEQEKRAAAEILIASGSVPMPILGIGVMDNIEIGTGRAEFLTLAAQGIRTMPVHIPRSCESDFKAYIADVKSPDDR